MSGGNRQRRERQRYWAGQTLRSRDLNDQLAVESEARWWHNRALHSAYGVVNGLSVAAHDGRYRVAPGLAYDCYGRELLRVTPAEIAAPLEADEPYTLLVRYAEGRTPYKACAPAAKEASLAWKPSRRVHLRDGVPLAVLDANGGLASFGVERPPSRALAGPLIGSGATVPGRTDWRQWTYPDERFDRSINVEGVEVTVDTSTAGFTDVPCYFASLHGGLFSRAPGLPLAIPMTAVAALAARRVSDPGFPVALERITSSRPDRFVFSLWRLTPTDLLSFARRNLYVCWLGIQHRPSRPSQEKYRTPTR